MVVGSPLTVAGAATALLAPLRMIFSENRYTLFRIMRPNAPHSLE
jgi:hypothetical protein